MMVVSMELPLADQLVVRTVVWMVVGMVFQKADKSAVQLVSYMAELRDVQRE
jgi:hypothetical protein